MKLLPITVLLAHLRIVLVLLTGHRYLWIYSFVNCIVPPNCWYYFISPIFPPNLLHFAVFSFCCLHCPSREKIFRASKKS